MALKKLPGGVVVETTAGARLSEEAGVNLEAIHRQLGAQAAAAMDALRTKADVSALAAVRDTAQAAQSTAQSAQSSASAAVVTAGAARATATNADTRVTALESAAGFGPSTPVDGQTASLILQPGAQTAEAVAASARARTRTLYPEDFGAKGDGIADDTAALEAWLASPGLSLRMGEGVYRTSRGLTSTVPGRTIQSDGGWIRCGALDADVLTLTGANTRAVVNLDGTKRAKRGIYIQAGGCDVSGSKALRCYSETTAAGGIWAETAFGVRCVGAHIEDIYSKGDTTIGNGNGAARGIYLGGSGIVASVPSLIEGNTIREVRGEEGDAIQVLATAAAGEVFGSMLCTVRGNTITGFSRRAIKVQASDVAVIDNECVDLGTAVTGSEHAVIYSINAHGNKVIGNRVDVRRFMYGVHVANSGTIPYAERTVVTGNDVTVGANATMALYVSGVTGAVVTGNRTRGGGVGTNVVRALDSTILDNVGSDSPRPMVLSAPLTGSTVKRNTVAGAGAVEAAAATLYSWAEAAPYPAMSVPSNTTTVIPWGELTAPWASMAGGRVSLAPGRYRVEVNVAGTPAQPAGDVLLQLWQKSRPGSIVRVTRRPLTAASRIVSWDVSATIVVGPSGDEVWTTLYQNSGSDLPLLTAAGYPYFRIDRID